MPTPTRISIFLLTGFGLFSCIGSNAKIPIFTSAENRSHFLAHGKRGMVASGHPQASQAGRDILQQGGNAVDAAIATAFALAVLRPHSTGIGGGGFLLHYDRQTQKTSAYDFRERAPLAATRQMYVDAQQRPLDFIYKGQRIPLSSLNGHLAVGVPGMVAGMVAVHEKGGKLPFSTLLQPAIRLAREGFSVYPALSQAIEKRREVMQTFRATREIFMPKGFPLQPGELLVQTDLATTLERIATSGSIGFYEGDVADKIFQEMREGNGLLSRQDFRTYAVKERTPLMGTFHGYRIATMPPPSAGGLGLLQILGMIEADPLFTWGSEDPRTLHLLAEAMRRAYADRAAYMSDPDFMQMPLDTLLSPTYLHKQRESISMEKAASSAKLAPNLPLPEEHPSTVHISVTDAWGNAVSTTQTINYLFGSCVVVPGTGIILNNEMNDFSISPQLSNVYGLKGGAHNEISPQKTMVSSMSPTLVFAPDGQLTLVLGAPGGSRIITATLQTLLNYLVFHLSLPDSVHAYRIHHQWMPDLLYVEENSLSRASRSALESKGHTLEWIPSHSTDVEAIAFESGEWIGVSDTRGEGQPMGL
jgi:gamma-glutamyltranspeptidase/glutathione hydrolase